jgi:hypothetical protein
MSLRRLAAALGLTVAVLLGTASPAAAASPSGAWSDPEPDDDVDGVPLATLDHDGPLKGVADFDAGIASVSFRLSQDNADGATDPCSAVDDVPPQVMNADSTHVVFSFKAAFPCNRRYQVLATITPNQRPLRQDTPTDLPLFVDVALPPADTEDVTATLVGSRRAVSLRWADAAHEPDFIGFEVRRSVDGGKFTKIGNAGPTATSFVDEDVPGGGGELRYRVLGMRSGPHAGSVVYAEDGDAASTTVEPVAGDGDDDGSTSGSGSGSGGSGTSGGSGSGTGSGGSSSPRLRTELPSGPGSRTATGRYEPPTTPTTADTGFQETLPFGPRQSQEALPSGDPAVVARIDDDDSPGTRETMLLVAGGGVAFSWAMALRFLGRRFSGL